jgi:hypothetical protein
MTIAQKAIFKSPQSLHSLEVELLLLSVSHQIDEPGFERILFLVQQEIDWNYLLDLAIEHKVIQILYSKLKNICPSYIPNHILCEMRQIFGANSKKNLVLTEKLLQIIHVFQNNNIPCLTFKGVSLGILAYQKTGLRTFTDLDILVPKKFISQATELLIDSGYKPQFNFSEVQQNKYLQMRNELTFVNPSGDIHLDLHWSLLSQNLSFSLNTESVWKYQTDIPINNRLIPSLSPEIMVLYLCAHGAKDSWIYLQSICDLARLIYQHPNLDWREILTQAGKLGTKRMLYLGLELCQDIFEVSLPQEIQLKIITEPQVKSLVQQVKENLFDESKSKDSLFKRKPIYLKAMDSWQDKLVFYFDLIRPTPLEWQIVVLPTWLSMLYYPLRLIRLAIKYSHLR